MSTRPRVLVVDDDPDILEVMELVLQEAGFETRTAANGRQALDAVAKKLPNVILLDMIMPVMDGRQFVEEFRARYGSDVPIVVVTAAEDLVRRCGDLDIAEVLPKPFDVDDLLGVLSRHVGEEEGVRR